MLEIVSKGFSNAKLALTGQTALTEENISAAVREIRVSLLEADVELGVIKRFLGRVKQRAIGEVITTQIDKKGKQLKRDPGDHFVKICHEELEQLMGPVEEAPITYRRPYTVIMMVGLQGTGKTTTCGKLVRYLQNKKRRPMLVAADLYRPAAVKQLQVLGEQLKVPVYAQEGLSAPQLCQDALRQAKKKKRDVIILDTAGRLAIDSKMMDELEEIKRVTKPDEIFLVCDAMAGQDTVKTASEFNRRLDLSGFIMTKLDGDARGGAALSIKDITGKPIKFLGTGEGLDAIEEFRPEGLASRILGMGDIVGLMQDFESVVDEKEAERDTKKMLSGKFTLDDFLKQIKTLQKMGSIKDLMAKFPMFGGGGLPEGAQVDESAFGVMESIIQSMTPAERRTPSVITPSRITRIAAGSGRKPAQVEELLQKFATMQQMMSGIAMQPSMLANLPGFKQLMGNASQGEINQMIGKALPKGMRGMSPSMIGGGMGAGMGMPGLPGVGNGIGGAEQGGAMPAMPDLPPGVSPEQYQQYMAAMQSGQMGAGLGGGAQRQKVDKKQKDKQKAKRKQARKQRQKGKRR